MNGGKLFGFFGFLSLSLLVVVWHWVPPRNTLHQEPATIMKVHPHASWVDVEMRTDMGIILKCHGRKSSTLCPLDRFQAAYDAKKKVDVLYKGDRIFEVRAGNDVIVSYDRHVERQRVLWLVSLFLVIMAVGVLCIKQEKR
jgi:hypothetical protein